jgi:hypothetical protein
VVNSSQGGGSKDTWVLASRTSAADRELAAAELVKAPPPKAGRTGKTAKPERAPEPSTSQQQQQNQAVMH